MAILNERAKNLGVGDAAPELGHCRGEEAGPLDTVGHCLGGPSPGCLAHAVAASLLPASEVTCLRTRVLVSPNVK